MKYESPKIKRKVVLVYCPEILAGSEVKEGVELGASTMGHEVVEFDATVFDTNWQ